MGLKVTLVKSFSGSNERQLRTIQGLGLKKFGQFRILKDTPEIRGMVFKVQHLVTSETVKDEPKVRVRRKPYSIRAKEAARAAASKK